MNGTCPWEREAWVRTGHMGHKGRRYKEQKERQIFEPKKKKKKKATADRSAPADFTHRRRRTVSALHWRWGEGRKNSERSRVCSHTSHSYSTRGPGTHSHLQRAPQTLVTVGTCGQGQLWLQVVDTIIPLHHNMQHRRQTTRLDFLIVHCKNKSSDLKKNQLANLLSHCFCAAFLGYCVHPLHVLIPFLSDTACKVVSGLYLEYCTWSGVPTKVYW